MKFDPNIEIGKIISNNELVQIFRCGNMGGMRRSNAYGVLVIISDQTKMFYKDEWKNDILYYTGMGKKGNQVLKGNQNKTLYESNTNGIEIHLFEVLQKKEYTYRGIAYLAEKPFMTEQNDFEGKNRDVWIFPLKLEKKRIYASKDTVRSEINIQLDNLLIDKELNEGSFKIHPFSGYKRKPVKKKKPKKKNSYNVYFRDKKISLNALSQAEYKCEIDIEHRLFVRKNANIFYTEPHHLVPMEYSDQFDVSLDVEENIVSLCSHCHNEIHYGRDRYKLIEHMYNMRKQLLESVGIIITLEELYQMYK